MPSDETRKLLKLFGVAVTNLEDALDRKAGVDEVVTHDMELADRWRDVSAYLAQLRSRRFD